MAAVTHAQIVAGKLEAIRLHFEWEDGTFHVFKQRKRLPKDRRDVHGQNLLASKRARTVRSFRMLISIFVSVHLVTSSLYRI